MLAPALLLLHAYKYGLVPTTLLTMLPVLPVEQIGLLAVRVTVLLAKTVMQSAHTYV